MKERIFAQDSVQTSSRNRNGSFRLITWMIFLVSVATFAESWAQTIPRPKFAPSLEDSIQRQTGKKAAVPETYRAPGLDLNNEFIPIMMPAAGPAAQRFPLAN